MRIIVAGYIVRGPLGGLCWHHLQYVLGLKGLGHEVLYLEDSDDFASCYNPETFICSTDPVFGLAFLVDLFKLYGLEEQWAYFDAHTNNWHGKTKWEVYDFIESCDILINISGVNAVRDWWLKIYNRIFIDTDPVFTQIKNLTNTEAMNYCHFHTQHFTFAENINSENCTIPEDGITWKITRQPVIIQIWKEGVQGIGSAWTTVMQWDSYKE